MRRGVDVLAILVICFALAVAARSWLMGENGGTLATLGFETMSPEFLRAAGSGARLGSEDAPVVLVVYSDYRCSFCRDFDRKLRAVRKRYPEHLAVVVKSFVVLDTSRDVKLFLGAECAKEQGVFEAFHIAALEMRGSHSGPAHWRTVADSVGVPDIEEFSRCVLSTRYAEQLQHDYAEGMSFGVKGVPASIVNGYVYRGSMTLEALDSAIVGAMPGRNLGRLRGEKPKW